MANLNLGQTTQKDVLKEINNSLKKNESNTIIPTVNSNESIKGVLPANLNGNKHFVGTSLLDNNNHKQGDIFISKNTTTTEVALEVFDQNGQNGLKLGISRDGNKNFAYAPATQGVDDNEIVTAKFLKDSIQTASSQIVSARFPKLLVENVDYTLIPTTQAGGNLDKGAFEVTFTNTQDGGIIALNRNGEQVVFAINWDLTGNTPKLGKCYVDTTDVKFLTFVTSTANKTPRP